MTSARTALLLAIILSLSCSNRKQIGLDDLRSEFTAAISFCAEAETLIDFVRQHRATLAYASGHLGYLTAAVQRNIGDLRNAEVEPSLQPGLQLYGKARQ